jgi:hypothetical protein
MSVDLAVTLRLQVHVQLHYCHIECCGVGAGDITCTRILQLLLLHCSVAL